MKKEELIKEVATLRFKLDQKKENDNDLRITLSELLHSYKTETPLQKRLLI